MFNKPKEAIESWEKLRPYLSHLKQFIVNPKIVWKSKNAKIRINSRFIVISVLFVILVISITLFDFTNNWTRVPSVIGLEYQAAVSAISSSDLVIGNTENYNKNEDNKIVTDTYPVPGSRVRKFTSIIININNYDDYGLIAQKLRQKLESVTGKTIGWFDFYDYDGDGVKEAFAVVGQSLEQGHERVYNESVGITTKSEELWFVSPTKCERLMRAQTESDSFAWHLERGYIGLRTFLVLLDSGSTSPYYWSVKNGDVIYHSEISGIMDGVHFVRDIFPLPGSIDFLLSRSLYEGSWHTFQPYYFYWDDDSYSFKEYGAIVISQQIFLQFDGAESLLNEITVAGYKITNILYRSNGIININWIDESNYKEAKCLYHGNTTLSVEYGKVILYGFYEDSGWILSDSATLQKSDCGGVFLLAAIPEIAIYPNLPK